MYHNPYSWITQMANGPTGRWHYPTPGGNDRPQDPRTTLRQDMGYWPGQSIGEQHGAWLISEELRQETQDSKTSWLTFQGDDSGMFGYTGLSGYPSQGQQWQGAGYPNGQDWAASRPFGWGQYQTIPLGVRGMTDNDDYDVSSLSTNK